MVAHCCDFILSPGGRGKGSPGSQGPRPEKQGGGGVVRAWIFQRRSSVHSGQRPPAGAAGQGRGTGLRGTQCPGHKGAVPAPQGSGRCCLSCEGHCSSVRVHWLGDVTQAHSRGPGRDRGPAATGTCVGAPRSRSGRPARTLWAPAAPGPEHTQRTPLRRCSRVSGHGVMTHSPGGSAGD